jgi:heat shock protein HslJ
MKTKNMTSIENPLLGQWTLISYNSMAITSTGYTLTFERDKVSGKFCNNMFGSYTLSENTLSSP